jgi:hypothetical protein
VEFGIYLTPVFQVHIAEHIDYVEEKLGMGQWEIGRKGWLM